MSAGIPAQFGRGEPCDGFRRMMGFRRVTATTPSVGQPGGSRALNVFDLLQRVGSRGGQSQRSGTVDGGYRGATAEGLVPVVSIQTGGKARPDDRKLRADTRRRVARRLVWESRKGCSATHRFTTRSAGTANRPAALGHRAAGRDHRNWQWKLHKLQPVPPVSMISGGRSVYPRIRAGRHCVRPVRQSGWRYGPAAGTATGATWYGDRSGLRRNRRNYPTVART